MRPNALYHTLSVFLKFPLHISNYTLFIFMLLVRFLFISVFHFYVFHWHIPLIFSSMRISLNISYKTFFPTSLLFLYHPFTSSRPLFFCFMFSFFHSPFCHLLPFFTSFPKLALAFPQPSGSPFVLLSVFFCLTFADFCSSLSLCLYLSN